MECDMYIERVCYVGEENVQDNQTHQKGIQSYWMILILMVSTVAYR